MLKLRLMDIEWKDGFMVKVSVEENTVVISANREGLLSLASQLTALANESAGSHIHYDEYNSLENNSSEMIIEKSE